MSTGNRSRGSEDPWKQMTGGENRPGCSLLSGHERSTQAWHNSPRARLRVPEPNSLSSQSLRGPGPAPAFVPWSIASKPPSPHHSGPKVPSHPMAPNSPLASLHLSPRASPPPVPHAAESPVLPSSSQLHPSE